MLQPINWIKKQFSRIANRLPILVGTPFILLVARVTLERTLNRTFSKTKTVSELLDEHQISKDKKLFCVLEQGFEISPTLTAENRKRFSTEYCDFYRLNHVTDKDPSADFYKTNISWSEGRSYLYEQTKGKYHYYMFIDDDIKFESKTGKPVAEEIGRFLIEYSPVFATLYGDNWAWNLDTRFMIEKSGIPVFKMVGSDQQCNIYPHDFADLMYPAMHHGGLGAMRYFQFVAYKLYPERCLTLNRVNIRNRRHIPQRIQIDPQDIIEKQFTNICKKPQDFELWLHNASAFVRETNEKRIFQKVTKNNPGRFGHNF